MYKEKVNLKVIYFLAILVLGAVAIYATPFMLFATAAYLFMVAGILNTANRKKHMILMLSAIVIDITLVLTLEFLRDAIATAVAFKLNYFQQLHIGVSTIATLFYFPMIYLGVLNYTNKSTQNEKLWHKRLGVITFIFRTLGFLFMFSMLNKPT